MTPEPLKWGRPPGLRRRPASGLYLAIALLAYVLSLWLGFPGYFAPLAPHHSDLYIPVGLLEHSPVEILAYPRPVAFEFLWAIGHFGVKGSIAAVIVLILAAVPLTAYVVQRFTGRAPAALAVAAYSLLLFAHPEFYFQHRHDVPAALSYLLMLIAVLLWWRGALWACFAVLLAIGLTKETYIPSTLILLTVTEWVKNRRLRVGLLAAAVAIFAATAGYNVLRYRHYVAAAPEYQATLAPLAVAGGYWFYLKHLFTAASLVLLAGFAPRWPALAFFLAGLAALLPHAFLPNHLLEEYAWVAAPLVFGPVLFAESRRMLGVALLLTAITVASYWARYETPEREWAVKQEQMGSRVLQSLDRLRRIEGRRILVTGLRAAYHPWLSTDFVRHELDRGRQWTVLTPRDGPQYTDGPVTLTRASAVNPTEFDRVAEYDADGNLRDVVAPAPGMLLIPELRGPLTQLESNPNDFAANLGVGVAYLEWGRPDAAEPYLRRAAETSNDGNAYPFFFLGQVAEARRDEKSARNLYARAASMDPSNTSFRDALKRVQR